MLFTTPIFLFFFLPLFISAYYLAPAKGQARNSVALLGSILFFSWGEPVYVFFLLAFVFFDYQLSKAVSEASKLSQPKKKLLLFIGILVNVAILVSFKYTTFILRDILLPLHLYSGQIPEGTGPLLLGISFITFHKISYLVDSYKGRAVPPRNFYDCALYIFLFPQLIAGPIIRYHDIGSQIHQRSYTSSVFLVGCFRFCIGFAKKILIADQLGLVADRIFALPTNELSLGCAWAGAFSYMLQIYFDFSGYSDMAIGLGCMMGFRFPENFNRPYISKSITEFWRRWHISLSSWMRQYLYIPLGGNRTSKSRAFINLWIVFLISGLWHGASWTFVAWGAYYGFFLCVEKYCSEAFPNLHNFIPSVLKFSLTMLIVLFGWVLFRAPTLSYAIDFMKVMLGLSQLKSAVHAWGLLLGNHDLFLLFVGAVIVFFQVPAKLFKRPNWISSAWSETMTLDGTKQLSLLFISTVALLLIATMGMLSAGYTAFLYFRF
ncbi:D-alanyl-lipoteichoic acid biosynthesis protein DltB [Legionella massiliensis]|uniref:Probable alginate O-acetylase n=1 Tax=Legionella massiliensis TaxID=1034943 RepID=A0A078KSD8_9GAMM|nr:MBOAT family O-acyltransferase [Legionella massiliensis]CDZ75976.1 D-alanyl-lipoteichoic acid biosynthesis protein DltB [Legionella massiliensis]CEE11714.1 Peptidoglycan O-acetyltransferase [Legionella massiliensis]